MDDFSWAEWTVKPKQFADSPKVDNIGVDLIGHGDALQCASETYSNAAACPRGVLAHR
jgi:hypothetical protein